MTKFTVKHVCGHEMTHAHSGPEEGLQQRREWLQSRPCQACWRQEESVNAEAKNRELHLPPLEGSKEDKAWAEVIRLKTVVHNRDYVRRLVGSKKLEAEEDAMRTAIVKAAHDALCELDRQRDARWWIEQRFEALSFVKTRVVAAVAPLLESRTK